MSYTRWCAPDALTRIGRIVCAAAFMVAGALHFVQPGAYRAIIPDYLPWPGTLVALTGAAEMAGGAGLLVRATRRYAALGLVLLLIAVLPANVEMLAQYREAGAPWWRELLLWVRLPMQLVLIGWVWAIGGRNENSDAQQALAGHRYT